ncbi:hypothetical protein D3C81_762720 [compost metagenome]
MSRARITRHGLTSCGRYEGSLRSLALIFAPAKMRRLRRNPSRALSYSDFFDGRADFGAIRDISSAF